MLFDAISKSQLFMVEFILCLNVTRKNTLLFTVTFKSKFDLVNKKKSILGQSPHVWVILVKEANRIPVFSFGTKVLTSYGNSQAAYE